MALNRFKLKKTQFTPLEFGTDISSKCLDKNNMKLFIIIILKISKQIYKKKIELFYKDISFNFIA